ncbi:MAG: AAA family ATPase [Thiogranum sp.]|nr:AAA family ATPase [Thiogranum sp.]
MYEKHFGLTERPFSIAPDPRFLYMSHQHREALAHLLYGVGEGGGFVQLTGEVGTGKTTICRCLLEQLPQTVDVALILNPRVTALELLASLCTELRIPYDPQNRSIQSLIDVLNAHLLETHARGRRTVLIIDEAQNLDAEALEQIRLLTNLETTREKLLQIILIGQPELRQLLARDDLRQLAQRITARYHLEPIQTTETAAYIRHRLQICGASETIFTDKAVALVRKLSDGVPRLINVICDRAMLGAFVEGKRQVDASIVEKAAREVLPDEGLNAPRRGIWQWVAGGAAVAAMVALILLFAPIDTRQAALPLIAAVKGVSVAGSSAHQPESAAAQAHKTVAPPAEPDVIAKAAAEAGPVADTGVVRSPLSAALAQAGPGAAARAWAGLYRLWGMQSSAVNDEQACAQAPAVGLRCLQGAGSWAALKHYDRPAELLLVGPEGRRVAVLLQEVKGTDVTLQVDGRVLEVPVEVMKEHWFGEYRLLWKVPPNGNPVLRPGDRNKDVQWLREQLQQVTGLRSIAPDPMVFDPGLQELLQSFQRERDLNADGVAGPRTLIHLNTASRQPSVPRLGAATLNE